MRQLKFLEQIASTSLRSDLVLTSDASKQEEAHKRKRAKHLELVEAYRGNGWRAHCKPIEVGFPWQSLHQALRPLGIRVFSTEKSHQEHQ